MEVSSLNPQSNVLGPGVTEGDVAAAVTASGYPLQTVVANTLAPRFGGLQEEWAYVDPDANITRTTDLWAWRSIRTHTEDCLIDFGLVLLIECKQSELPYVFFVTRHPPRLDAFPRITSFENTTAVIELEQGNAVTDMALTRALGFLKHAFVGTPPYCLSFSRLRRTGKRLEASGAEAFASIVTPLGKALDYLAKANAPFYSRTVEQFDISLGLVVLDAPMVVAEASEHGTSLRMAPWVRVVRREPLPPEKERGLSGSGRIWTIDAVHAGYLTTYLDDHLIPFAEWASSTVASRAHHFGASSIRTFTEAEVRSYR